MPADLRSAVKDALATLMQGVTFSEAINGYTTFVSVSRRLKMFNKIDPSVQPALFVVQHRESYENRHMGTPPVRILDVGLWAFAPTGDESLIGDHILDVMFEGIENAFVPDNVITNEVDFHGLCSYCTIDRRDNMLIRDPGDIDGQALLVVPVRIMLP